MGASLQEFRAKSVVSFCVKLGNLGDSTQLWVPVVHVETFALERVLLHALIVEGADCVQVGSLSQLLQLLGCLVQTEHLFDAVEVFAHVVSVLEYAQCTVNLVLKTLTHFY